MATPNDKQVRFVITRAAQVLMDNAAHPDMLPKLRDYARAWFPDADPVTLDEVAGKLRIGLEHMATLMEGRLQTLIATGRAEEVTGSGGRPLG